MRRKRREDLRFLTGQGSYLDDLAFDGLTHAMVLRSPHAHARIQGAGQALLECATYDPASGQPVAAFPAIGNALAAQGADDFTGPATPEQIWRAMRGK